MAASLALIAPLGRIWSYRGPSKRHDFLLAPHGKTAMAPQLLKLQLDDGGWAVTAAFLKVGAAANLKVGDLVGCGISHPCTAFDKWRLIPVVDDSYAVIDAVLTYF